MNYELLRLPRAIRQLRHLRKTHHPRVGDIIDAIEALAIDPRPPQSEKLNRTVIITAIAHRREVYR